MDNDYTKILACPRRPKSRLQAGFTLIEIMIVIVIIGLLAAIITPRLVGRVEEARVIACKTQIKGLETALQMYTIDNGMYPTTDQGLHALVEPPVIEPIPRHYSPHAYQERIPLDQWGNEYFYLSPGNIDEYGRERSYEIISPGPNGQIDDPTAPGYDDITSYEITEEENQTGR